MKKKLREMFDTPYHIGYVKMTENDSRRDKRRCIYFERNDVSNSFCKYIYCRCPGSSHCKYYNENIEDVEKINIKFEGYIRAKKSKRKIFVTEN